MLPHADRREIAAIFAGGALGTLLRAALSNVFPHPATSWPWPTVAVNVTASFLLGYFVTRLRERLPLSSYRRPRSRSSSLSTLAPALPGIGRTDHRPGCARERAEAGTPMDEPNGLRQHASRARRICLRSASLERSGVSPDVIAPGQFGQPGRGGGGEFP
jgi:hypothetical protein